MASQLITISIGEEEISFDEKKVEVEDKPGKKWVELVPVEQTNFKFEFKGLLTDKFVVKKYRDIEQDRNVTEIWLERGLPEKIERTPLVRLVTHQ